MPRRNSVEIPGWLHVVGRGGALSLQAWSYHMDALFNCDSYLQFDFQTAERLKEAETELETAREEVQANAADDAAAARVVEAGRWLRRVRS